MTWSYNSSWACSNFDFFLQFVSDPFDSQLSNPCHSDKFYREATSSRHQNIDKADWCKHQANVERKDIMVRHADESIMSELEKKICSVPDKKKKM